MKTNHVFGRAGFSSLVTGALLGVTACSGAPDDGGGSDEFEKVEQAIVNGSELNPEGLFFVSVHHGGPDETNPVFDYNICSGTLVRNDAVITARHCVTELRQVTGTIDTQYENFELRIGSQVSGVKEIVDLATPANNIDAALIITDRFFTVGGTNTMWKLPIFAGASTSLVGTSLFCVGYGLNSVPGDPYLADILRYANLTPSSANVSEIVLPANSLGQITWHGDSGGTCLSLASPLSMTGIHSMCSASGAGPCTMVSPEAFRATANTVLALRGPGFIHTATSANTSGHITTLDHPSLNYNPGAIVSVTPNWNPQGSSGVYDNHDIGIYYSAGRWRIFNQDIAPIPLNAAFNVTTGSGYAHLTTTGNTVGNSTILNHPSLNNNPNAAFIVTPHWNPPGSSGVYNNHPIGVWYDGTRWNVYNQDNISMPVGTGFTIRFDRTFSVRGGTVSGNTLYLDDPNLNGHPEAQVFVTPNFNPGGQLAGYVNSAIGVWYNTWTQRWGIFRQDGGAMPSTAGFNVLYRP